jgi:trk system potassium uptake protein TrkH
MLLRPQIKDFRIIGFYLGKVTIGLALFMVVPVLVSLFAKEWNPFYDFVNSFLFSLILGLGLYVLCYTREGPRWSHGMIIASFSWVVAAFVCALPLFLSGHYRSFLDAYFEAMSGLTTSGLTLTEDMSHMAYSHNLWRHLIMFIGGQGIVVVALSLFVQGVSGAFRLYVGEARDERVLPNIRQTARFIWKVSFVYLIFGTTLLTGAAFYDGIPFWKALFHGACIFMAAFDTGGFAPYEQSLIYYHSFLFEIFVMIIMILGAINFRLHYAIWSGQRKEIWRNFEIQTMTISIFCLFFLVALGLSKTNVYPSAMVLFRKGFFQLISAHTGAGHATIYAGQFFREWGSLAIFALIFAMALGGCISSTTGGIKAFRVGAIFKAFASDTKQYVSPEAAVFVEKIHHIRDMILTDKQMRSACLITLAYTLMFFFGAIVGMICGYPFAESLFESVSATGNVGLSCGITAISMPVVLKLTYIIQMWAGRLEFVSVLVLFGFAYAVLRGK